MSDNTDYGFDLDSILAEFSSDSGTQGYRAAQTGAPRKTCGACEGSRTRPLFLRLRRVPRSRYGAQPNRRALRLPHLLRYGRSLKNERKRI